MADLARLASLVESSEDAIVSKDLDGKILTWNRGAAALYGYSAEEMVGQSIGALVPPDRIAEEERILAQIRAGLRVQHFETVRVQKNGRPIHVSLTISPVRQGNRIIGASHVARDISERKRLESGNAQLAAIVASSADAIISTDLDGTIQTWNASAERIYGYSRAEALERNIRFLMPAGCDEEEAEILDKIRRAQHVEHFDTLRFCKGGLPIYISLTVSPIRDRTGRVTGASHVAREITERRRLEAANAQLAAIIEFSEDAIISKDLRGVVQTWNRSAERLYGYSPEEAVGRSISFLLPPERAAEEQEILARIRRGERVEHFETTRLRSDGTLVEVSLSISPIRNMAGIAVGASHVARDITARKKFEEQMRQTQRLESLGVLAGGIAHDFNNLLTGIIGNASLISDTLSSRMPERSYLDELLKAAERAADLTKQMLAYAGKGQFFVGPINISDAVEEIAALVKSSVPKTTMVRLDLGSDVPMVDADLSQIQQLVMNLIINGAEATMDRGSGTVVVKTGMQWLDHEQIPVGSRSHEFPPGNYAYVEVRDDGCGMDEKTLAKIFDPFFTTKFTGRGLGLAAALGIVNAHRGAIRVESSPGEGTTFRVFLPVSSKRVYPPVVQPVKDTILVVDDEETVRRVAKSTLENYGYRVILASNGEEALELFRDMAKSIVLVILDVTMPVLSGEETLPRLREIREVPVLMSSGHHEDEAMRRFGRKAIAGFLQKPYTSMRLREKVDAALKEQGVRAAHGE